MMAVAASATLPAGQYTLPDLENLSTGSAYYATQTEFSSIRQQAMQQAAQALGMQAALSYESTQIDQVLDQDAPLLSRIFDFNQILYQHNVLPPVLDKANHQVNINGTGDTIRIAGTTYRILAPVRFVTAPPTWRDYIWMSYPPPQLPSTVLLPTNDAERQFWQTNVALGWDQGINQAVSIYQLNLARLVRDYNGMVLYKELLAQNMVSPYHLAYQNQGITGNGNDMIVDDQTAQITAQPQLQLHGQLWQTTPLNAQSPVVSPNVNSPANASASVAPVSAQKVAPVSPVAPASTPSSNKNGAS
jgi:defect-in-organelle-trafficking protein DotC